MHIRDHLMEKNFFCELCKKTFKTLDKGQEPVTKPCTSIKEKEVLIDIEEQDDEHKCNACSSVFNRNEHLERHIEKNNESDCLKCGEVFRTKADVYSHAKIPHTGDKASLDRCR